MATSAKDEWYAIFPKAVEGFRLSAKSRLIEITPNKVLRHMKAHPEQFPKIEDKDERYVKQLLLAFLRRNFLDGAILQTWKAGTPMTIMLTTQDYGTFIGKMELTLKA